MGKDIGAVMDIAGIFSENKGAIAFALLVMLAGSAGFFAFGNDGSSWGLIRIIPGFSKASG